MLTASVGAAAVLCVSASGRPGPKPNARTAASSGKSSVKGVIGIGKRVGSVAAARERCGGVAGRRLVVPVMSRSSRPGKARFCVHNASCAVSSIYQVGTPGKRPDAQVTVPSPSDVASNASVRSLAGSQLLRGTTA